MIGVDGDEESEDKNKDSIYINKLPVFIKTNKRFTRYIKKNLCLYAYPDGTWQIKKPSEELPAELPEPTVGINFARDGMERKEWLFLVANHSYSWLLALAFYFAARFGFQNYGRQRDDISTLQRLFLLLN